MKQITFKDGSTIIFNERGNTYIGEFAHSVMHAYHKFILNGKVTITLQEENTFWETIINEFNLKEAINA